MQKYDAIFGTDWERTNESLMVEWEGHQKYWMKKRGQDIDFDNGEEGKDMAYFENKAKEALKSQYGTLGGIAADIYNFFA